MPATQVGVVQMESAQKMVDDQLKNKIAILMELLSIKLCLQTFRKDLCNKVICIMSDKAAAISYVNHMGETKSA